MPVAVHSVGFDTNLSTLDRADVSPSPGKLVLLYFKSRARLKRQVDRFVGLDQRLTFDS
jgi:hypothetical protein